jgi:hypothetical protein
MLFDPQKSTVLAARTLRYDIGFSKFKNRKLTDAANLDAPNEEHGLIRRNANWQAFCPVFEDTGTKQK